MKNKNKNLQRGIAPLLIIAIIAILAIGAGTYVVVKNKKAKVPEVQDNLNTQANGNADMNANAKANLGINAKGSLRSLLGLGKNMTCTFSGTNGSTSSSGTVYVSADGSMRGDFTIQTGTGTQTSSMIVKDKIAYVWTGSQGVKMDAAKATSSATAGAQAKSSVDLDSQVNHTCVDWTPDASKFVLPVGIKFLDLGAMMKGSALPSGLDVKGMTNTKVY